MKLVARFTATERHLLRWAGGRLSALGSFSAEDAGLRAWGECLAMRRDGSVTLVVDLPGEEFHEDRIPRLRGGDRAALIGRRLEQRFGDARFAAAWSLDGGDPDREHERLVLASPGRNPEIAPWLEALRPAGIRLAGVHSTASLVPALLARCPGGLARGIVLAVFADGLRECGIENGRVRFARYLAGDIAGGQGAAQRVHEEAERLAAYLATLRVTPVQEALPALVIAGAGQRTALQRAFGADSRFDFRFIAHEAVARSVGLRGAPDGMGAERLFLALAAGHPPREQFARPAERRAFVQWRLGRALLLAGAAGCAASAAYTGVQWLEAREIRDQAVQLRQEARAAEQRQRGAAAVRPGITSADIDAWRQLAKEAQRLAEGTVAPEPALMHLSRALGRSPRIELEALAWTAAPAPAPGAAVTDPAEQTLEITARVLQPKSDMRTVAEIIGRFTALLLEDGGWTMVRARLPFDLSPQGTLKGGHGTEAAEPTFVLVIARARA